MKREIFLLYGISLVDNTGVPSYVDDQKTVQQKIQRKLNPHCKWQKISLTPIFILGPYNLNFQFRFTRLKDSYNYKLRFTYCFLTCRQTQVV